MGRGSPQRSGLVGCVWLVTPPQKNPTFCKYHTLYKPKTLYVRAQSPGDWPGCPGALKLPGTAV